MERLLRVTRAQEGLQRHRWNGMDWVTSITRDCQKYLENYCCKHIKILSSGRALILRKQELIRKLEAQ